MKIHQLRTLNSLISTEQVRVARGSIQGIVEEQRTRRGSNYRTIAYVDYATENERLTLRAQISGEMLDKLSAGSTVRVIYDPANPRVAVMDGADPYLSWGRRIAVLLMVIGTGVCMQLFVYWIFSPSRKYNRDLHQEIE